MADGLDTQRPVERFLSGNGDGLSGPFRHPSAFSSFVLSGVGLFSVIVFLMFDFFAHMKDARVHADHMMTATARVVCFQIERFFNDQRNGLDYLSRHPSTVDVVFSGAATHKDRIMTGWLSTFERFSRIDNVTYVDTFGRTGFIAMGRKTGADNEKTWRWDRALCRRITEEALGTWDVHWLRLPPVYGSGMVLVKGVRDSQGKAVGALVLDIDTATIDALIKAYSRFFVDQMIDITDDHDQRRVFGEPVKSSTAGEMASSPGHGMSVRLSLPGNAPPDWYVNVRMPEENTVLTIVKDHQNVLVFLVTVFVFILSYSGFQMWKSMVEARTCTAWIESVANGDAVEPQGPSAIPGSAGLGQALARLTERMADIKDFCRAGADGNFSDAFPVRGDKDALGTALNGVRRYFRTVYGRIDQITRGDYTPCSDDQAETDELAPLLTRLKSTLRKMSEESYRQITGAYVQVELVRQLSESRDLESMLDRILSFICGYSGAQVGVFYVITPARDVFSLKGTYGCMKEDVPCRIKPGEGLCGQAAIDRRPLFMSGESGKGPLVKTGLVEASPASVVAYPFIIGDEVVAVMELGALYDFKRDVTDIIGKNSESISIGIQSALARSLTDELLLKTMEQAESLTVQQNSLQAVNRELEAQTHALRESEARLMAREEELKKANESLRIHSLNLEETKAVLETKADELAKSNRYKTEFLANMSHELRTPLNSIILLSGILAGKNPGDGLDENSVEKICKFASVIQNSGKDLLNMIDEVLDLTRISAGAMPVSISRCTLLETAKVMKRLFDKPAREKQLAFDVHVDGDLPVFILTDQLRLEQILKNLLSNAFKYTGSGEVHLTIRRPKEVLPVGMVCGNTVEFAVTDTGEGIPGNMQSAVFEAFKQVDGGIARKHEGAGLGLSLAREFARLLQGDIMLASDVGKGSTFSLFLPEEWIIVS